eukprot:1144673-Pelagomonas_calceolata.AAC.4
MHGLSPPRAWHAMHACFWPKTLYRTYLVPTPPLPHVLVLHSNHRHTCSATERDRLCVCKQVAFFLLAINYGNKPCGSDAGTSKLLTSSQSNTVQRHVQACEACLLALFPNEMSKLAPLVTKR